MNLQTFPFSLIICKTETETPPADFGRIFFGSKIPAGDFSHFINVRFYSGYQ